jgi:hypothetical protein
LEKRDIDIPECRNKKSACNRCMLIVYMHILDD